jgi:ecotin
MKTSLSLILATLLAGTMMGQDADNMKAFPPAEPGMVRYVLNLPPESDEDLRKVELIVGKTVQTDGRNQYSFTGKIEEDTIEGWGYTRYLVKKLGKTVGTLIGVDPKVPKVDRFITLGGRPYLIRYNSKLPVVVYVPDGAAVHYRVWRAPAETKEVRQG